MSTLTFIATFSLAISFAVSAEPTYPPDTTYTPQQAYEKLLSVHQFNFGGVGFSGATSEGELAYRSIAASTNALALYSAALTNANTDAGKLYALCGIQMLAPETFDAQAKLLRTSKAKITMMSGCIAYEVYVTNIVAAIARGHHDHR